MTDVLRDRPVATPTPNPTPTRATVGEGHRAPRVLQRSLQILIVFAIVVGGWEVASLVMKASPFVLPSPFTVADHMWRDRNIYPHNTWTTTFEALRGFGWGVGFAALLGVAFVQIPFLERALMSTAIASYCVPVVAIGPVLEVVSSGSTPKVVLSAIGGFFPTLIAILLGLRSADRTSLAVVEAFGGGSWSKLVRVRIRSALPSFFAGLRIAGPAAVVGAIIGEYLGGDSGLGVAMISSTQTLNVARTWGLAVMTSLVALGFYLAVSLVAGRLSIVPTQPNLTAGSGAARAGGRYWLVYSVGRRLLAAAMAVGVILLGWILLIKLFHLNHYFAKTPADVFNYVFTVSKSGANRAQLLHDLGRTIHDSLPGLAIGTATGVFMAIVFVRSEILSGALMPVAIALQSAPIVALTPLITLTFGRDILGITVIVTLVTFFPTLLNVMRGLRSAPVESLDLVRAFGGSRFTTLIKVEAQAALPSLFASLKIAVPGAIFGTMLAEFISSGNGLGYAILLASTNAGFAEVWAGVVLITAATVGLYGVVGFLETATRHRYAPDAATR